MVCCMMHYELTVGHALSFFVFRSWRHKRVELTSPIPFISCCCSLLHFPYPLFTHSFFLFTLPVPDSLPFSLFPFHAILTRHTSIEHLHIHCPYFLYEHDHIKEKEVQEDRPSHNLRLPRTPVLFRSPTPNLCPIHRIPSLGRSNSTHKNKPLHPRRIRFPKPKHPTNQSIRYPRPHNLLDRYPTGMDSPQPRPCKFHLPCNFYIRSDTHVGVPFA